MPTFTDALDVDVGDPTKASDYDSLADNTEANREFADIDHDFTISTGTGHHNTTIHFGTALAATTIAFGWWEDSSGSLWLLGQTGQTSDIARGTAEFYIQLGDIRDVPTS